MPPEIPDARIPFERVQLVAIWERIELIDKHFERCCAFQMDWCHYGDEYNELYGRLHLAGVEEWRTPWDAADFWSWLNETYPEPAS